MNQEQQRAHFHSLVSTFNVAVCTPMRIGLLASNAALAEYFVTALGMADHAVTLYPAVQDLVSALAVAASLQGGAPHEVSL